MLHRLSVGKMLRVRNLLLFLCIALLLIIGTAVDASGLIKARFFKVLAPTAGNPNDLANSGGAVHFSVNIDATNPSGTIRINNGATYTKSTDVILSLFASDGSGSGVDQMRFKNGGGSWSAWESYGTMKSFGLPVSNGEKRVWVQFKDKVGNVSSAVADTIILDSSAPAGSIKINRGTIYTKSTNVTLNISASETGGSGLDKMRFKNRGGSWSPWETYKSIKAWTLRSGDGTKRVYFEVKDKAGNKSTVVSDTIIYDSTVPKAYVRSPWISTNRSKTTRWEVRWFGVDRAPSSGIKNYTVKYRADNQTHWTFWKVNTTKKKANFTGRPGRTYTFKALTKDNAGNQSAWSVKKTTIVPYDQDANVKRRSGFSSLYTNAASQYYKGTVRHSRTKWDWIKYRVTGKSVHLLFRKGPNRSRAKVYVDGKFMANIDTYSSSTKYRKAAYNKTWSRSGTHEVKVINMATAGRKRLDVDGVGVGR